jgi:hypothetical protein
MTKFNAENANAARLADAQVAVQGPTDFEVKKDPYDSRQSYVGVRASEITDYVYLLRLGDLQDFFGDLDTAKAQELPPGGERNTALKNARYSRLRAASARYYAWKLPKAPF